MPVANRVSGSAFERDEQLAIAMFEVAGVEAYKRGESMNSNTESPSSLLGWAWNMGWRRSEFLFEVAQEKRSQEADRRKSEYAMMAFPPGRHNGWFA